MDKVVSTGDSAYLSGRFLRFQVEWMQAMFRGVINKDPKTVCFLTFVLVRTCRMFIHKRRSFSAMTLLICAQGECGICPLYYFVSLRIPQYKQHYHVTCIDNAKFSLGYFHFKIISTELLDLTKLHLRLNLGQLSRAAHIL